MNATTLSPLYSRPGIEPLRRGPASDYNRRMDPMETKKQVAPGEGVLLDIEAELEYWRRIFPTTEFRDASLPFEDYVPTIKFGYDCFLLFHRQPLAEILPSLRDRYNKSVPRHQQLDWRWADQIVRHAWGRMRGS